ncbi:MAG: DNA mismatch repair endonuclease MutL, partial [Myxococcota bacterium]
RPASVVKELVENALDAGASHITVEVEQGGKRLIRVLDNGCGMTAEGARTALLRHATSKLSSLDDLFSLGTMGFRGEALPSIAAVSRMTLITRVRDQVAGVQLDIAAGEVVAHSEVGAPVGTRIEVRDLLYNVPARLKFLKGNATEASHVTDVVSRLAMANPHVHVRLRHGSRTSIDAPPHNSQLERTRALLGSRFAQRIHRVHGAEGGIEVDAYLTAPELAQTTSRGLQLYVGTRPIKDRGLMQAVSMGYGELLAKGRYPVAVIFIAVPGETVDVNVHPQKQEVRFSDPQAVYAAVRHVVRGGVAQAPWLSDSADQGGSPVRMRAIAASRPPGPGHGGASSMARRHAAQTTQSLFSDLRPGRRYDPAPPAPAPARERAATPIEHVPAERDDESGELRETHFPLGPSAADRPVARPAEAEERRPWPPSRHRAGTARAAEGRPAWPYSGTDSQPARRAADPSAADPPAARAPTDATHDPDNAAARVRDGHADRPGDDAGRSADERLSPSTTDPVQRAEGREDAPPPPAAEPDASHFFSQLRYIGQLDRTYLICEANGEMVLVDQHAAHERVAFQRLRERYQERDIPVQRLLFAQNIELTADQAGVALDHQDALNKLGFELEPFGGATFALKTAPAGLQPSSAAGVLSELLSDLAERGGSRALEERLDLALATIACHSVVRAGDSLSEQEAMALFQSMDGVDFKAYCPHGRPVLLRISIGEIARRFGRT